MVKKLTQKAYLSILVFASLIIFAITLDNLKNIFPISDSYLNRVTFTVSICIYIGVYSYWTISVYRRIMQNHVRNYLMLIGANIILWITIRTIKWSAFDFVIFEDRILWYMYYIPMIMLTLFFLFISLYVGKPEDYQPSKKWLLLYIPAVLILIAILTNDIHGLAFIIDKTTHAYGRDYSHGPVYFIALFFILSMVIMSSFIIVRKFSLLKEARKKALMPALVITITILYCVIYIIKPNYGIGYVIDLTVFGCTMAIALLEAFIRTGLIHSNMGHSECFAMADIRAQILDSEGAVVYISENSTPITKANFDILKKDNTVSFNPGSLSQIAPISGGYVVWNSNVAQISEMIKNLKIINNKLFKEVDTLTLENEQKSEGARLRKLNDIQDIMLQEILPLSEKMKSEIENSPKVQEAELKRLLFETSMTSTYIKRKVNLILTEQTEKSICVEDMRYCFLESFQLLKLYEITCAINIIDSCNISLNAAIASFDLYQNIIESAKYNFNTVYVTYNFNNDSMTFAVQISGDMSLSYNDLLTDKLGTQKGEIRFLNETDSYYISLVMPK